MSRDRVRALVEFARWSSKNIVRKCVFGPTAQPYPRKKENKLNPICVRSWCNWRAGCVAAKQWKQKQNPKKKSLSPLYKSSLPLLRALLFSFFPSSPIPNLILPSLPTHLPLSLHFKKNCKMMRPNNTMCNSLLYLNWLRSWSRISQKDVYTIPSHSLTMTVLTLSCSAHVFLYPRTPEWSCSELFGTYSHLLLFQLLKCLSGTCCLSLSRQPLRMGATTKIPITHHTKTNQPPTHPLALELSKWPCSYPPATPWFTRAAHLPHPWLAKESSSVGRALALHRLAPRWLHPSIHSSKGLVCVLSLTWYLWHVIVSSRYLRGGCATPPRYTTILILPCVRAVPIFLKMWCWCVSISPESGTVDLPIK